MLFSFLKKIFQKENPKYSVGYFTLCIPDFLAIDILKLLYRSKMEELPHSSTLETLLDLFYRNVSDKKFICDRFFNFQDFAEAAVATENLSSVLVNEKRMSPFLTRKIVKEEKSFSKKGEFFVCVVVSVENLKINKIRSKKDLAKVLKDLYAKPHFNDEVTSFSLRFQGSDDMETRKIEDQILELKLNVPEI